MNKIILLDPNKFTKKATIKLLSDDNNYIYDYNNVINLNLNNYDLIIVNQLENTNYDEIVKKLKGVIPIALLSNDILNKDYYLKNLKFDFFIEKPITKEKVINIIKSSL